MAPARMNNFAMEKIGFLFAGQGTQFVGMAKDLYDSFPESRLVFDKAEKVLGYDLKRRCFEGPEGMLKTMNVSQPAIVTSAIAAFEACKKKIDFKPEYAAGFSLGECSALIAAEGLTFEDGIKLIRRRNQLLEDAARKFPSKTVEILDLSKEKVEAVCFMAKTRIVGFNCPGQIVISGTPECIDKAAEDCLQAGAGGVNILDISGPLHSPLAFEFSVELKIFLENLPVFEPLYPVISNYTARPAYKAVQIKENLVYQMRFPVKWEESMRFMLAQGVSKFIEFGPGKVLKGLMRKIDPSAQVLHIEKAEDILNLAI